MIEKIEWVNETISGNAWAANPPNPDKKLSKQIRQSL